MLVNLNVFTPVSKVGFVGTFGFGIKYDPMTVPWLSETNLTFVIVASAPLVNPFNLSPVATLPKNCPCACSERLATSTLRIVEVAE